MSKKCTKCTKTVYPTEELKCLDKIWHKACFKCEVCGMTLNMKNYKGYDKLPYCNAHYPTTKHTQVADTPESRRIAENTKIQSQVQYHADFEKQKGHKTSVAEDPEIARIKQNTAIQSNLSYWGVREMRTAMEEKRPQEASDDVASRRRNPGKISDYDPGVEKYNSPYAGKTQANIVYDSNSGEGHGSYPVDRRSYGNDRRSYGEDRRSYTDDRRSYTDDRRSHTDDRRSHTDDRRSYTDDRRSYNEDRRSHTDDRRSFNEDQRSYTDNMSNAGRRQPGSISDYDPMSEQFGSVGFQQHPGSVGYQQHPEPVRQPQPQPYQPPPSRPWPGPATSFQPPQEAFYGWKPAPQKNRGMVCKAMYDYCAADTDEVTFCDGDTIVECHPVDAGWMTGRVERTGQYGMLPSNYVERIN